VDKVKFEVIQMAPKFTNSILVSFGNECIIFDSWGDVSDWETVLENSKLKLRAIYCTHGHFDHISAAPSLTAKHNVPWYLNHRDINLIAWANEALSQFGLLPIPENYQQPLDLKHGVMEPWPGLMMGVMETPGHSSGGVVFHFPGQHLVIIGDTLFQETVGRYDLPGADKKALMQSVARIYDMHFPDDTIVLHGHGPDTTIGLLRMHNPFFNGTDDCDDKGEHYCCGGNGCCCGHRHGTGCGCNHDHNHECQCNKK
jgi:glyoxylase-like metal-dependent hydrolase (beta-lactamase superfamily II)